MFWFGVVANAITVLAGLIAVAGVIWAVLGRARLTVTPWLFPSLAPTLTLTIASVGSNPVRDLEVIVGMLDDNGFSMRGGDVGRRAALNRGEVLTVIGYEPEEHSFGSDPQEGEFRFPITPGSGLYMTLQWRSPLFPWRRSSRTYAWSPVTRYANQPPVKLTLNKEIRFLERTRDPAINPTSPAFEAPSTPGARAVVATDESFDGLVAAYDGPVLAGFGPTWQGKSWEDVKRVLDAFAARKGSRVRVLVVNTDECPALAERFATDVVPVFKLLRQGEVTKSHNGILSFPELEREFDEWLR